MGQNRVLMELITEQLYGQTTTLTIPFTSSSQPVRTLGSKWEVPYMEVTRLRDMLMTSFSHFQEDRYVYSVCVCV